MSSLALDTIPHATQVRCTAEELVVFLNDGRVLSVPLVWFPRLARANPEQLSNFELLDEGEGIHWPGLDEDISVLGLLEGRKSVEYRASGT
ncbi:DUF2442 domain-containing protein [Salinisphaera sp.]|uniref:DUF2442 domain-containing protein n=1 Tax=Salinisphaera sp. TaxID=1914330 RepID=UPI002D78CEDC|nr:DUF2442 domain-containing protein [Salinisphaera sp.]HET7314731.1 DUF2442 domain-containing protein [Salinisphaera sp.]